MVGTKDVPAIFDSFICSSITSTPYIGGGWVSGRRVGGEGGGQKKRNRLWNCKHVHSLAFSHKTRRHPAPHQYTCIVCPKLLKLLCVYFYSLYLPFKLLLTMRHIWWVPASFSMKYNYAMLLYNVYNTVLCDCAERAWYLTVILTHPGIDTVGLPARDFL